MISFQPRVAFGFPYLLIELFYIGMPVVRTNVGRSVYGHENSKFSRMGRLPHFLSYGASRRAWSSAKKGEGPFGNKHRSRVYSIDDIIY